MVFFVLNDVLVEMWPPVMGRQLPEVCSEMCLWSLLKLEMAKMKRWQNLQKSVQTQPSLSIQPNAQPTTSLSVSSVQVTRQLAFSVQAASQLVQSIQAASQSTSSCQGKSQPEPFKKRVVGCESTEYWTVETTDSEENRKKLNAKFIWG